VCETWLLTLKEELILKVFEIKLLRRIFYLKDITEQENREKLHNQELRA
jgi:hypothetical protein